MAATPPGHPDRAMYLSNLGAALRTRFERTGERADLDEAVTVGRHAVAATPPTTPTAPDGCPTSASPCGSGSSAPAARPTWTRRSPPAGTRWPPPRRPPRPRQCLSNLGVALRTRFERTGDQADLDEAVTAGRHAVAATPPDHPDRAGRLSNLGVALRARFERTGGQADLDEAIAVGRDAVAATPPDHPDRARYLSNLGAALRIRFERTGDQADLDEAIAAGRDAAAVEEASPRLRAGAARGWGRAEAAAGNGRRPWRVSRPRSSCWDEWRPAASPAATRNSYSRSWAVWDRRRRRAVCTPG